MTWTAAASPHILTQAIQVLGATLTVEPCAQVELAAGVGIEFAVDVNGKGAKLAAVGAADRPITFSAHESTPWGHLDIVYPAAASLAYVALNGGGSYSTGALGATIHVVGADKPMQPLVSVDHVTITRSAGVGLWLDQEAALTDSSSSLTITQCGDATNPYPIRLDFAAAGGIPSGTYTGNAKDEIYVADGVATNDITMRDRGVPYRMAVESSSTFQVSAATLGGTPAVLTIEPNVRLRMEPTTRLAIGSGANPNLTMTYPGSIVAQGTAAQPIVFTSAADKPAAGDWVGLQFTATTMPANVLDHVSIEYAGGPCGCDGFSCLPTGDGDSSAVLIMTWVPAAQFLTNSAIVKSAGNGVLRGWAGGSGPSFLPTNTFDVAQCQETLYTDQNNGCPNPTTCQ